ncbi:hypothetical protein B0J12DRAFT_685951 [Macrophomina phaseolina]|uniref:Uncharacterized protein n=1 Tax=Macrophomina phaseolina TaxID=35725 RepID=A0ABQ8FUA9_9PEZI|nr:hypothetical protein B0J12DRAFT_685951 [Macrophomina phaseolina]
MRFSGVILSLASLGSVLAAVKQPVGRAEGLFKREADPGSSWEPECGGDWDCYHKGKEYPKCCYGECVCSGGCTKHKRDAAPWEKEQECYGDDKCELDCKYEPKCCNGYCVASGGCSKKGPWSS